jgi:hypothetical protein
MNLKSVMREFATEQKCIDYLVRQRWNGVPICPYCNSQKSYVIEKGRRFKCGNNECYKKYSVTVGTIFHASNLPLTTWLPALYLITAHKKGISSCQLARDLEISQKSAWFVLHRIRKQLQQDNSDLLSGTVEIDETYMSKKFASEYVGLSPEKSKAFVKKAQPYKHKMRGAVVAIAHPQTGQIRAEAFNAKTLDVIKGMVNKNVEIGSTIHTDEALIYKNAFPDYTRKHVNHWRREWVKDGVTVNHVENFFGVMKRGVVGIYHQISFKHLQAYINEFSYRYNSRKTTDGNRFETVCTNLEGRLTYKQLVYGKSEENNQETT